MKILGFTAAIGVLLVFAGSPHSFGSEAEAKKAVLEVLKDPYSAKFGEFTQVGAMFACLTVNAKNIYGGYTGNQQAYLRKNEDGKWESLNIFETSHDACVLKIEREAGLAEAEADRVALLAVVDTGGGVLTQSATGLKWTQSDNGFDIDWESAVQSCASMGKGWRLPTIIELLSIHDTKGNISTSCAPLSCRVSPLFQLSATFFWSDEEIGSSDASGVNLYSGLRIQSPKSVKAGSRTLCVRSK